MDIIDSMIFDQSKASEAKPRAAKRRLQPLVGPPSLEPTSLVDASRVNKGFFYIDTVLIEVSRK